MPEKYFLTLFKANLRDKRLWVLKKI